MRATTSKRTVPVRGYFANLRRGRASCGATQERSLHGPLDSLESSVGATLHGPAYYAVNAGLLRMEWSRILLSGWYEGSGDSAAVARARAAACGRELAQLLDPNSAVSLLTHGASRAGIAAIAKFSTPDRRNMIGSDVGVTARGASSVLVMP